MGSRGTAGPEHGRSQPLLVARRHDRQPIDVGQLAGNDASSQQRLQLLPRDAAGDGDVPAKDAALTPTELGEHGHCCTFVHRVVPTNISGTKVPASDSQGK